MKRDPVLSLLGLALRGGNLVMGEEPVEGVSRGRDARLLLLASDASDNTRRRITHFADVGQCIWVRIPFTKEELGATLGRTSVAVAAVTDVGLAAAVAHRLEQMDPAQFAETAKRLDLKAQRAAERRQEQRNHERNVRTGKYHGAKKPAAPKAEETAAPSEMNKNKSGETRKTDRTGKISKSGKPRRPYREERSRKKGVDPRFAHSRPVKKGKGSVKKDRT